MGITTWGFGSCCGTIGVWGWGDGTCNIIPDILVAAWTTAPSLDYCCGTRERGDSGTRARGDVLFRTRPDSVSSRDLGVVLFRVRPDSISSRPRCALLL